MAGKGFTGALLAGERTIAVTAAERDWLYNERVRAMVECPNLEYQRARRSSTVQPRWLSALRIYRRDKDGSLVAKIILKQQLTGVRYTRKLRVPASLGSTSRRGVHLRRAHKGR